MGASLVRGDRLRWIIRVLLISGCGLWAVSAQSTEIPVLPQDLNPPDQLEPLLPDNNPSEPPEREDLLTPLIEPESEFPSDPSEPEAPEIESTEPEPTEALLNGEIVVTDIRFSGNSLFSEQILESILLDRIDPTAISSDWTAQTLTFAEILQLAVVVADFYQEKGYETAGAVVRIPEATQQAGSGEIVVEVIEGVLQGVELTAVADGPTRLNSDYVRDRLNIQTDTPLNVDQLQESLQLLQLDPLVSGITAELNAGTTPGSSLLAVQYQEAPTFDAVVALDNERSPGVGSFQRQIAVSESNLSGIGDSLNVSYANSAGSDTLNAGYTLPLNANNGTLEFGYTRAWNDIVEAPFDDVNNDGINGDIESNSSTYEITYRQPLSRSIKNQTFQEFALGMGASVRESQSFLLDQPFPLSAGAEANGETNITALRFFQDWTRQDAQQIVAVRSRFSLGLDALDSTINTPIVGAESRPDSQFFSWRLQAQWVRRIGSNNLLLLRGNMQLADQGLLSAEQLGIGGANSVRGYRQDQLLTDNGVFASAEMRFPVAQVPDWDATLQLAPFVDFGSGWNSSRQANPDTNVLASAGLGLQWAQGDNLSARLDFGLPLVSVESSSNTWQESGLYFSVIYDLF